MFYLDKEMIDKINQNTIERNGGQFIPPKNHLHGESIDYLVESIDGELFGNPLYPTVADKAAVYMFSIISNHAYSDGNKRTGLAVALIFLDLNQYRLRDDLTWPTDVPNTAATLDYNDVLEAFTLAVASAQLTQEQCREWFARNVVPAPQ